MNENHSPIYKVSYKHNQVSIYTKVTIWLIEIYAEDDCFVVIVNPINNTPGLISLSNSNFKSLTMNRAFTENSPPYPRHLIWTFDFFLFLISVPFHHNYFESQSTVISKQCVAVIQNKLFARLEPASICPWKTILSRNMCYNHFGIVFKFENIFASFVYIF